MSDRIPVNSDVLRWARESAGLSIEEVVRKLKRKRVDVSTVKNWEAGESSPSYSQLERLAYEVYKRPLAVFFFPAPPKEVTPKESFRTLPDHEISKMSSGLRYIIRQARVMQINLAELTDVAIPDSQQMLKNLKFKPDVSVSKMAAAVREYLGKDLSEQGSWNSADVAFKTWRSVFESSGVFVFKNAFRDPLFSGFCIYDESYPIIYVNNSKPQTRQIFTLFHELAHLLLGTGGIDGRLDEYISYLRGDDRKTEVLCNRFAAEFLVPESDFRRRIKGFTVSESLLAELANFYCVSREVILRKFLDRDAVSKVRYDKMVKRWNKISLAKNKTGGNYYLTQGVYLGNFYLDLAFRKYYQKRISVDQLAGYLGVKVSSVPGVESRFLSKGNAR